MVRRNRTRMNFLETFQQMIDEYNAGAVSVDEQFQRLMAFYRELEDEQQRTVAEGLSEEELAVYDLLTKPEIDLSPEEVDQVKEAAKTLLNTLKREKLGLDWRKKQTAQAEVRSEIRDVLDDNLPDSYSPEIFDQKCSDIYQHVYESYFGAGRSIFGPAA
jgi:type I restriction enzyme R subunit